MINFDEMLNGDKENGTVGIFDYSEEEQEYEEELEYGEELEDDLNDNQIEKLLNKKYEQEERLTSEDVELKVLEYKNGNLKAFDDIYNFYSDLSGITVEEIKEMEFGTLPMMILDSFIEVKNTGFFKVLSKLL